MPQATVSVRISAPLARARAIRCRPDALIAIQQLRPRDAERRGQLLVDLPAQVGALVHQQRLHPGPPRLDGGGQGRSTADDEQLAPEVLGHRRPSAPAAGPQPCCVCTRSPGLTEVMQARRFGRPSTTTRQS